MSKLSLLSRILIVASPFFVPWWAVLVLVLAALFLHDSYYEIIFIGLICDVLYVSEHSDFGLYGLTLLSILLLVVIGQIRKRLIMY